MIIDIIGLLIFLLLCYMGYRRGAVISIISILGFGCSYVGAYLLCRPFGNFIQQKYDIPIMLAYAFGGMAAFLFITLVFMVISAVVSRVRKKRREKAGKTGLSPADKWLGAVLGAATGFVIVVMAFWAISLMKLGPAGKKLPDVKDSIAGRMSTATIEWGTYIIAEQVTGNPELSYAISHSMSDPAGTAQNLEKLVDNPRFKKLVENPEFRNALLSGNESELLANPALNELFNDPEIVSSAKDMGLISSGQNGADLKNVAAKKLAKLGRNYRKIQNDPEIRKILQDEELKKKLENSDVNELLMDPQFNKLITRILKLSGIDAGNLKNLQNR